MALGTITVGTKAGVAASAPLFAELISFAGDGAYGAGGTAGFKALVEAKVGGSREILAVIGQDCGGYVPVYDKANDKLKVYEGDYDPAAVGPLKENATADLSAVTFNVLVISQ